MKILSITVQGLPLFKEPLDIVFYAQQRVSDCDRERLFRLWDDRGVYLQPTNAFIGINASGKTSVLKAIHLAMCLLNNEPINHVESRTILGGTRKAVFHICFCDLRQSICCLETEIVSKKAKTGGYVYSIVNERLWVKPKNKVKSKRSLTDFSGINPVETRQGNEAFLSDDVSFIIAHNKRNSDSLCVCSSLSYTNVNVLPFSDDIPTEVIAFLDPTIEYLRFERVEDNTYVRLKFYDDVEILLNNTKDLEQYLSSGTIKGIVTFSMAKETLENGGYLLVDEIENHFNKEIVTTLMRFFMDSNLNKKGGVLLFTTHYPELLDEYDRNDGIYIVRNRNGIVVENLSYVLKRNDIKKSDAYQSGFLEGTAPSYQSYLRLKKRISSSIV